MIRTQFHMLRLQSSRSEPIRIPCCVVR